MQTKLLGIALLTLGACNWPTQDQRRLVGGSILLSSRDVGASLLPGPFVSVADRVDIRATNDAGEVVASTRFQLQAYESTASATLEVPEGSLTFGADVSTVDGTVLYSGSVTAQVTAGFAIEVPLIALRPVLVVQPDTIRTTGTPAQFTVHNGGLSTLDWRVNVTSPNCAQVCSFDGRSGLLSAEQSTTFVVSVPLNQSSGTYQLTVDSPEGGVPAIWVYTRPTVIGFSVVPDSARILIGQQTQLTVTTQSGPTNASWTSADTRVATVTPTGLVTGVTPGQVWIHAVSLVTPASRDSSRVSVEFPSIPFRTVRQPPPRPGYRDR